VPNIDDRGTWLDPIPFDLMTNQEHETVSNAGSSAKSDPLTSDSTAEKTHPPWITQDVASIKLVGRYIHTYIVHTIIGCPAAAMTMSAWRTMLLGSGVRECTMDTVASALRRSRDTGRPTMLLRPTTTAILPLTLTPPRDRSSTHAFEGKKSILIASGIRKKMAYFMVI
jgi:hypothetical protein